MTHAHGGADKHAGHSVSGLLGKFWIVLILTVPVLAYSDVIEGLFGGFAPHFPGYQYAILLLSSVIFFYGGWIFIAGAYRELRSGLPGMMTLIALAITAAYAFSCFSVLSGGGQTLFWELSTLIAVMLLGHWIEMKAVRGAEGALDELARLLPDTADVVRAGQTITVPIGDLAAGDMVIVRPGTKVPADGMIIDGRSELDESILTGESRLVGRGIGDAVIAGSINGDGGLEVRVSQVGERTFLSGIMRLVAEAQASKSRMQILSDRAAFYLTLIAIAAGAVTFAVWYASGAGPAVSFERLVAVLVIACPHALGLAVPLVASISTAKAARNGALVRQRLALEAARAIDIVLFDKTGTLTKGEFGVVSVIPAGPFDERELLALAGSINGRSEHPLAKAITEEARKRNIPIRAQKDFERVPGKGARATIDGGSAAAGNRQLMDDLSVGISDEVRAKADEFSKQGKTIVFVAKDKNLMGAIVLSDIIRDESRSAVSALKRSGIGTAMITGDSEDAAAWVAKELEIDQYFAKVLPDKKAETVRALQEKGHKVAMVGDGVNDAPALAQADLGIAIGAGTNIAIESAGIILVKNDPRDIAKIIALSKMTYAKMMQNLFWATGYNIVALPLAAGVLASRGLIIEPALSAAFMSASTVIVALNAALLHRKKF